MSEAMAWEGCAESAVRGSEGGAVRRGIGEGQGERFGAVDAVAENVVGEAVGEARSKRTRTVVRRESAQ